MVVRRIAMFDEQQRAGIAVVNLERDVAIGMVVFEILFRLQPGRVAPGLRADQEIGDVFGAAIAL